MNPFLLFWYLNDMKKIKNKNMFVKESLELEKRVDEFYKTFER